MMGTCGLHAQVARTQRRCKHGGRERQSEGGSVVFSGYGTSKSGQSVAAGLAPR